ncbi:MAG: hypothetical protein P8J50_14455 [Acidimicrobiales bacterium]|nr:hypothetical protein [Acidimicrobiales bacterium]
MRRRVGALLAVSALVAAGCGDSTPEPSPSVEAGTTTTTTTTTPEAEFAGSIELTLEQSPDCELIGHECLLPFPSDALTVDDASAVTGRRVALPLGAMPSNVDGVAVDPSRQNLADGFSPGSAALALIPGVDPAGSGLPPITDIAASLADGSASVIVDATTGEQWPHWAELDSNAPSPDRQGLFLRPAQNYPDGHRIVIGLRNLVDGDGAAIAPTDTFRAYRDRLESDVEEVEARRPAMERVFADLEAAGVVREELVLAWEFTVISTESLTGPLVHMRDDAFASLDGAAPTYTIDAVTRHDSDTYTIIEGTYDVPLYLTGDGGPGTGLNTESGSLLPTANGTWPSVFRCLVHDNTTAADPGGGVIYGHGLLGDRGQATSTGPRLLAEHHNHVICGTDLIGMAEEDTINAIAILGEASTFFTLSDRLLQGHLNTLFLGRLMKHPDGFAADPAFRDEADGQLLDTEQLAYYGISQGGIMGPVSTAVSTDWSVGVFGVPAVNYSTLLNRSIDFDLYQAILDPAYPDKLDQAQLLLIMQMLWDRGEGNGYVNHYTQPLAGLDEKRGLLHGALGDHQVANVAMDVMARSMGAAVVWPAVGVDRTTDVEPFWAIPHIDSYPHDGSATVMWDSGTPVPPIENVPPRDGTDPHEDPRRHLAAVEQIDHFLRTGTVIDVCGGEPCISPPR